MPALSRRRFGLPHGVYKRLIAALPDAFRGVSEVRAFSQRVEQRSFTPLLSKDVAARSGRNSRKNVLAPYADRNEGRRAAARGARPRKFHFEGGPNTRFDARLRGRDLRTAIFN